MVHIIQHSDMSLLDEVCSSAECHKEEIVWNPCKNEDEALDCAGCQRLDSSGNTPSEKCNHYICEESCAVQADRCHMIPAVVRRRQTDRHCKDCH